MRDKRVKNPLLHSIERGMTAQAALDLRRLDRAPDAAILGPAEKLVRKFAIRKAIRAKIRAEVSNNEKATLES